MKITYLKFFTGSAVLATMLLSGCGGGENKSGLTKQPHNTSKLDRTVALEKDWTWDVGFSTTIISRNNIYLSTHFWDGIPDEIVNFQIFIDMDSDQNTGYSGSNGWEICGADYLLENGDVYKSLSNSEWKWELVGEFKEKQFKKDVLTMRHPVLKGDIFNIDNFKVMIEAYDKNWGGDYSTITGIDAEVNKLNSNYLVAIAKEYRNKFVYKTIVVKDNGIVEFQVKEDDGVRYKVVYDYKNNKEISKTLIDGNSGNIKKVLVKKSIDRDNDGVMDSVSSFTYYDNGKLKTKDSDSGPSITYYNEHGDPVKYSSDSPNLYRYTYNANGKIEKRERLNDNGTINSFLHYEYNAHGDKVYTYKNDEDKPQWYFTYEYDANGNIIRKDGYFHLDPYEDDLMYTETFKYDNQNRVIEYYNDTDGGDLVHYTKSYNDDAKEVKRIDLSYDDEGVSYDHFYEYDSKGYLIVEKIDSHDFSHLTEVDIDRVIYYEWK